MTHPATGSLMSDPLVDRLKILREGKYSARVGRRFVMRYFFDTEFREDGQIIDLISIGIVAEDGRELYAVSTEARLDLCDSWLRENVLAKLPEYGHLAWMSRLEIRKAVTLFTGGKWGNPLYGTTRTINDDNPEIWAWYGASDWVAFYQLFGKMIDLPDHLPRWFHELKQLAVEVGVRSWTSLRTRTMRSAMRVGRATSTGP